MKLLPLTHKIAVISALALTSALINPSIATSQTCQPSVSGNLIDLGGGKCGQINSPPAPQLPSVAYWQPVSHKLQLELIDFLVPGRAQAFRTWQNLRNSGRYNAADWQKSVVQAYEVAKPLCYGDRTSAIGCLKALDAIKEAEKWAKVYR